MLKICCKSYKSLKAAVKGIPLLRQKNGDIAILQKCAFIKVAALQKCMENIMYLSIYVLVSF